MEANNTKSIVDQINAGTKTIVEESGKEYNSTVYTDDRQAFTETEHQQFTKTITDQINEGAQKQKEYNEWYEKTYGSKNTFI